MPEASTRTLWMINHYAIPPGGAGGTRHYTLAKELQAHGWRTVIIAASTEMNTGKQRLDFGELSRLETLGGVEFLWLRTPSYKGNGLGRVINMFYFALRVAGMSRKRLPRPDIILGATPHPFGAYAARVVASQYKVPYVYEIGDLWPQGLVELGKISPKHPLMRLFGAIERNLCRRSTRIVTLLPGVADYLEPLGVKREKVDWIPNGVDLALFESAAPTPQREPFTFMYFGAHGTANGLDNVLRAMKIVEDKGADINLRLIGDGPFKEALQKLAKSLDLRRVRFEKPVAKERVPLIASEADGLIFNLVEAPVFVKYGISSNKLFDYLASARPILFACEASNNPVADAQAGITVKPQDPQALAEAMLALAAMPIKQRQRMGANGKAYVTANHGFAALAQKMNDTLLTAVAKKGR